MYFYWLFLQKCNFSQAQRELHEDGPNGPKHVAANIRYFNVNCLIKDAFAGKKELWRYQNARYNDKKFKKNKRKMFFLYSKGRWLQKNIYDALKDVSLRINM